MCGGMGAKEKKALKKKLRKNSSQLSISRRAHESSDFVPLEGGPGRKISEPEEPVKETATVLYIGRIPHGFYEEQMEGFFQQFGKIKRLRIARNRKPLLCCCGIGQMLSHMRLLTWEAQNHGCEC